MNYRKRIRLLSLGALGLALLTGAVLVGGFLLPVEVQADSVQTPEEASGRKASSQGPDPRPDPMAEVYQQLGQLASRPLRQELKEPEVPAPPQQSGRPRPSLSVSLVGTALEPSNSMAVFRKRDGSIQWARLGETIETASGNVTLEQVTQTGVRVRFGGVSVELELPEAPETGGL